jgi:hypothetical protein
MKIKSSAEISKKWDDAIGRVPAAYKEGVAGTTDWQEKAASDDAENLWKTKIDEAAARKARQKAIGNVSNEDWRSAAVNKGSARIGAGMTAAKAKRASKFEPYRSAIEGLSLPPKTADPAQNVTNRVIPIATTLSELKKSLA